MLSGQGRIFPGFLTDKTGVVFRTISLFLCIDNIIAYGSGYLYNVKSLKIKLSQIK